MITLPPDTTFGRRRVHEPQQVSFFREKLIRWRMDLLKEANLTLASLSEGGILEPDISDRASVETDRALELRTRDRARKLIVKINLALHVLKTGLMGFVRRQENRSASNAYRRVR